MTDETHNCAYCSDSFHGERTYLKHLRDAHYDELGTIDQRRVDNTVNKPSDFIDTLQDYTGPIVLGLMLVVAGATLAFSFATSTDNAPDISDDIPEPGAAGSVHQHGTMAVVVDGEQIDFSQQKYQRQNDKVHFESGGGESLHIHATGVTPAYTLETLGFTLAENGSTVEFQGAKYSRADGDTVQYQVNGQEVNPYEFELRDGDQIRIVLEESNGDK
jgi:hypothetical protein